MGAKFLSAVFADVKGAACIVTLSQFACTYYGATHLSHSVRFKAFPAHRALFISVYPISMFVTMAFQAQGNAIIYIMPKFWMILVRLDMVRLQYTAALAAFLAGVIVTTNYSQAPFPVFSALTVEIPLALFWIIPALVVREAVALLHCLFVHSLALFGSKQRSAGFADFFSTFRGCVRAFGATVPLFGSFSLEGDSAVGARSDHGVTPKKIPCLCRWLLLSRQLAPMHSQGILPDYTPTFLVLQAA